MLNTFIPAAALAAVALATDIPPITDQCLAGCIKSAQWTDLAEVCHDAAIWNAGSWLRSCNAKLCLSNGWDHYPPELTTLCQAYPPIPEIKDTCLRQCIVKQTYSTIPDMCSDSAQALLNACNQEDCHDNWHDFKAELNTICKVPGPIPLPQIKNRCLKECVKDQNYLPYVCHTIGGQIGECMNKFCYKQEPDRSEGWAEYKGICGHYPTPTPTTTPTPTPTPNCEWDYRGMCRCDDGSIRHGYCGPRSTTTSITCTFDYRHVCRCSDGTVRPNGNWCIPLVTTSSTIPTITTTPPYPISCNSTLCSHPHPGPTVITTTETKIETITWCPPECTCHGQTTTWTYTFGPTSCQPETTCTCVLPGKPTPYPTLTSCPRSVTCTGQTTTITGGATVVLPSESFNVPVEPTNSLSEFPGSAATGGVGVLAMLVGVLAAF